MGDLVRRAAVWSGIARLFARKQAVACSYHTARRARCSALDTYVYHTMNNKTALSSLRNTSSCFGQHLLPLRGRKGA